MAEAIARATASNITRTRYDARMRRDESRSLRREIGTFRDNVVHFSTAAQSQGQLRRTIDELGGAVRDFRGEVQALHIALDAVRDVMRDDEDEEVSSSMDSPPDDMLVNRGDLRQVMQRMTNIEAIQNSSTVDVGKLWDLVFRVERSAQATAQQMQTQEDSYEGVLERFDERAPASARQTVAS